MNEINASISIKNIFVTCILTAFGSIAMFGSAEAICPDGRPEPCIKLTPLTPSPLQKLNKAPVPKVQKQSSQPLIQLETIQEAAVPQIQLLEQAAQTTAIMEVPSVTLTSSDAISLGNLVMRLKEIDNELIEFNRDVGAENFYNLLESLVAFIERRAPNLSSSLESSRSKLSTLISERREINRQIRKIVTPGEVMKPDTYVEMTRSGPSDSHYQVHSSKSTTTGAVVGPNPGCRKEVRTRVLYKNILLPNGFDSQGTPLYRNECHPFPVSETVDVCK